MESDDAMKISQFGEVNQILEDMLEGHKDIFSQKLLGYYVLQPKTIGLLCVRFPRRGTASEPHFLLGL